MAFQLTRSEQLRGQSLLCILSFTNALGFGLTIGQVIYLLALEFKANDLQMGFFYGAHLITSVLTLLVPSLLGGKETTWTWSRCWWARAFICLTYFALPFVPSSSLRVWLLLFLYYLFLGIRALAMPGYFVVVRGLTSLGEERQLIAKTLGIGQVGTLLTQTLAFSVSYWNLFHADQQKLYFLIGVGTLFNMVTSYLIGLLPPTGEIKKGRLRLWRLIRITLGKSQSGELLIFSILQAALNVAVSYLLSFLKNVMLYNNAQIFFFTVMGILASIAVSYFLKLLGNYANPRLWMFLSYLLLFITAGIWLLWPTEQAGYAPWVAAAIYAITTVGISAGNTIVLQLRTELLPSGKGVEVSIVFELAGMLGALFAIGCIYLGKLLIPSAIYQSNPYEISFFLWLLISGLVALLTLVLRREEIIQNFTTIWPGNIFTIYQVTQIGREKNIVHRHLALEGILLKANQISRYMLVEELNSPDIGSRAACMRVLNGFPDPQTVPFLIEEAKSHYSPLQADAITTLGFHRHPEISSQLMKLWQDEKLSNDARAALLKSLERHKIRVLDEDYTKLYPLLSNPRAKLDFFTAMVLGRRESLLFHLLFQELQNHPDRYWSETMFVAAATLYDERDTMIEIFKMRQEQFIHTWDYMILNYLREHFDETSLSLLNKWVRDRDWDSVTQYFQITRHLPWAYVYDESTLLGVVFLWYCQLLQQKKS